MTQGWERNQLVGKGRSLRKECATPGCNEYGHYTDLTPEGYKRLSREPWYCVRHTQPEEVLGASNLRREKILENVQLPHGRYWNGSSGFAYGPGFKAYADDFPAGTKIRVIAEVIPAQETFACLGGCGASVPGPNAYCSGCFLTERQKARPEHTAAHDCACKD
jgi:hypothetical protein